MKFRQFKTSFSEEFERPSNAGCKQNFTLRPLVREAPQVLVDRKRDPRVEGIHLRIPKSPESNTWGSTEAQIKGESSMRFANPDGNRKKTFELHLWKNVSRLVQRCQGNCRKPITKDCFGTMYLHFEKNWLQSFGLENHHGPSQSFLYSRITVNQKCKGNRK